MTKARPIVAIAVLAMSAMAPLLIAPLGAQQPSDRAKHIGGKFMCMCGCSQVLTECNHVGCTTSASMLKELNVALAQGDSEDTITQMFVQEFGTKVYAEPPKSGFSLVAWVLPSVYLFLGTGVVIFVIFRWRKQAAQATGPATVGPGVSPEQLERARAQVSRETQD
jgi:cytochrome c-type biogenesis protein CcmH/NrfF